MYIDIKRRTRVLIVVVQSLSGVQLFETPWTAAHQASLFFTTSWSLSIRSVMSSNHLILYCPLHLLPQSFPASRSFQMSQFFTSGGQSIGFNFNISPSNEYSELISFRIDYWISLQSKGLLRVFSNTTVQKHQSFNTLHFLYGPTFTSIHD